MKSWNRQSYEVIWAPGPPGAEALLRRCFPISFGCTIWVMYHSLWYDRREILWFKCRITILPINRLKFNWSSPVYLLAVKEHRPKNNGVRFCACILHYTCSQDWTNFRHLLSPSFAFLFMNALFQEFEVHQIEMNLMTQNHKYHFKVRQRTPKGRRTMFEISNKLSICGVDFDSQIR